MDFANGVQQFVVRHPFEKIRAGTGRHGLMNVLVAMERSEHDKGALGKFFADQANGLCSADFRQTKVHQAHIGLMLPEKSDRLFAGACLGHHDEIRRAPSLLAS
jgi:hypothetical protein